MAKKKSVRNPRHRDPEKKKLNREQISILGETNYIINRAQHFDSRVVSLGSLIFFSTETGDSWMLDCNEGLALCLARDGGKQRFRIVETPDKFAIEWNATYQIEGDKFTVIDNSGQARTIIGYPTEEILNAIQRISI